MYQVAFHEVTPGAVRRPIAGPRAIDMDLVRCSKSINMIRKVCQNVSFRMKLREREMTNGPRTTAVRICSPRFTQ